MNHLIMQLQVVLLVVVVGALSGAMAQNISSFKDDRDGKTYKTVTIGAQTWMAENLNYQVRPSKCYADNASNCNKYGRLVGVEAMREACPEGWHIPSKGEWNKLLNAVGGEKVAGKKLKAKNGWNGDGNGSDDYGFSALPGGYVYDDFGVDFKKIGVYGYWWTTTSTSRSNFVDCKYTIFMSSTDDYVDSDKSCVDYASVRCVKDDVR